MNGKTADEDLLATLEGLNVDVVAGSLIGDTFVKPLTREGAQNVIDRLRARGYKITKE